MSNSMTASHQPGDSRTTDFAGIVRRRLENVLNKVISAETGIDASHLSKVLAGRGAITLDATAKLLNLAGLKAVDQNRICVRPDEIDYLRKLYARVSEQAPWLLNEAET
jgi:hypothetical protein